LQKLNRVVWVLNKAISSPNKQKERIEEWLADSVIVVVTLGFLWRRETDFHSFSFAHIPCQFNNKELGVLECWEPPHLCFWAAGIIF